MIDAIRVVICGVMAITSLLAAFALDGTMHQLLQEDVRIDLVSQINGARKFLLMVAITSTLVCFL